MTKRLLYMGKMNGKGPCVANNILKELCFNELPQILGSVFHLDQYEKCAAQCLTGGASFFIVPLAVVWYMPTLFVQVQCLLLVIHMHKTFTFQEDTWTGYPHATCTLQEDPLSKISICQEDVNHLLAEHLGCDIHRAAALLHHDIHIISLTESCQSLFDSQGCQSCSTVSIPTFLHNL